MSTARQGIRSWLREVLVNKTSALGRVYINRRTPVAEDASSPIILIYGGDGEEASPANISEFGYIRSYHVVVDIRSNGETVDDDLDLVAEEIESAIESESTNAEIDEKFISVEYNGFGSTVDSDGEIDMGSLRLNFTFKYLR